MAEQDRKDTKSNILDAAERLMAEHGVNGVSLRAILAEAGANSAALHYHFGSRAQLVEAIVARRGLRTSIRRREIVDDLFANVDHPGIEDIVNAIVDPMVEMLQDEGETGRRFFRFLARLQSDRVDTHRQEDRKYFSDTHLKLEQMMRAACPNLSRDELRRRMTMTLDVMLQSLANAAFMTESWDEKHPPDALADYVRTLKSFLAGGLSAPALPPEHVTTAATTEQGKESMK